MYIGYRSAFGAMNGIIDEVRVYNRALSLSEIKALYNKNKTQYQSSQKEYHKRGLVGYWSFDGPDVDWSSATAEILDRSGNGNNGDSSFDSGSVAIGKIGQALFFDGVDDGITLSDQDYFSPVVNNITFSFWARVPEGAISRGNDSCGSTGRYFIGKDQSGVSADWGVENDNNSRICFLAWQLDGNGHMTTSVNRTVNDNEWHHYAGSLDYLNEMILYVDGIQVDSTTSYTSVMGNSTKELQLGRRGDGNYMSGYLDEVRIYNYALSDVERTALYNSGKVLMNR